MGLGTCGKIPFSWPIDHMVSTLTTYFRYRRLGDLNREPATLCVRMRRRRAADNY